MLEYFVARHGQSEWNQFNRIQGQTNTRLSSLGLLQSQYLFQALREQPLTDIYTSALDRTIQTAQPLAQHLGLPIQSTELLNELAFGDLVGKYLQDLDQEHQEIWDWWMEDPIQRAIPGGESYQDLLNRVRLFLDDLYRIEDQRSILIVGHLRANQVLIGYLTGLSLEESIRIRQPNNWLYHLNHETRIKGAAFPSYDEGEIRWQPGLLF